MNINRPFEIPTNHLQRLTGNMYMASLPLPANQQNKNEKL